MIKIGDLVVVNETWIGTVIDIRKDDDGQDLYTIRDQDDDCFDEYLTDLSLDV